MHHPLFFTLLIAKMSTSSTFTRTAVIFEFQRLPVLNVIIVLVKSAFVCLTQEGFIFDLKVQIRKNWVRLDRKGRPRQNCRGYESEYEADGRGNRYPSLQTAPGRKRKQTHNGRERGQESCPETKPAGRFGYGNIPSFGMRGTA